MPVIASPDDAARRKLRDPRAVATADRARRGARHPVALVCPPMPWGRLAAPW